MKLNNNTKISSTNLLLVPYRSQHVPKYHEWMKSNELQKLTASEPLTLEQEYEMQKSWRDDEDKCTFIIIDKNQYQIRMDEIGETYLDSMIGDTNIFIIDRETFKGEIEIMIAEPSARGKRYGWEAVILMLIYGIKCIQLRIYEAKISLENEISIKMFNKLGFHEESRSDVFQEVTLQKEVSNEWMQWLESKVQYQILDH